MFVLVLVSIATLLTTQVEGHAMFYSVGISGSSDVRGAGKLSTNGVAVFGPFSKASQILCRGEVASAILTPFDLTATRMTVRVATLADHGGPCSLTIQGPNQLPIQISPIEKCTGGSLAGVLLPDKPTSPGGAKLFAWTFAVQNAAKVTGCSNNDCYLRWQWSNGDNELYENCVDIRIRANTQEIVGTPSVTIGNQVVSSTAVSLVPTSKTVAGIAAAATPTLNKPIPATNATTEAMTSNQKESIEKLMISLKTLRSTFLDVLANRN